VPFRLSFFAFTILSFNAGTAWAQQSGERPEEAQSLQSTPAATPDIKFKLFDSLGEKGMTSSFPGSADTILRDLGGFRSALAEQDIGFEMRNSTILIGSLTDTGQPRSPQRYNGQRLTMQSNSMAATLTFGLDRLGLGDTALSVGGIWYTTTFRPNSPSTLNLRALSVYHKALNGRLEIKAGYITNLFEYAGLFTGGSPVLASGVAGLIPIQAGLSAEPISTPAINVTVHGDRGFYVKGGVQRSVSPRGRISEVEEGRNGFRFSAPGAGALTIGEVGIQRPAGPDGKQMWLRAGGFTNNSDFQRFDGTGVDSNEVFYAAADFQLSQPDGRAPARGWYAGASAFGGRESVNLYTKSVEARVYGIGVIPSRPSDVLSAKVTWNKFGDPAVAQARAGGEYANEDQWTVNLNYSAHAANGVIIVPSLSYLDHPSFIGDFKPAVLASMTAFLLF
jgi:hypothetical protein